MNNANNGLRHGRSVKTLQSRWTAIVLAMVCSIALTFAGIGTAMLLTPAAQADTLPAAGSIAVNYTDDDTALAGVDVRLHNVANWSSDGGFAPSGNYKKYDVDWNILNASAETYRQLAETLAGYTSRDNLAPRATTTTDSSGFAEFTDLPKGLYLAVVGSYSSKALTCKASATLVALPANAESGQTMSVTISPKTDCETTPTQPETVKKKVRKIWKGDAEANRPTKIVAQLLEDGKVYDEVALNQSNDWSHEWTGLEDGHEWRVAEKTVPDNYTVLVDREGAETLITNTYRPPEEHNPPKEEVPPPSKTPPADTGANVAVPAACAVILAGVGLVLVHVARRKRAALGTDKEAC